VETAARETGQRAAARCSWTKSAISIWQARRRLLDMLPDGTGVTARTTSSMRIISSTTRNLEEEMHGGRFREELYYRINGVNLRLPPLRQRKDDISGLLDFFLKKYASLFGRPSPD